MKKVYFNHIIGNIHPVYQEMLDNPPYGVTYINKNNFGRKYHYKKITNKSNIFFKIIKFLLSIIHYIYILPNITFKKLPGDITYSCQSIPLFGNYILDLDCYEGLNRFSNKISENYINKYIILFFIKQKRCKKIIFWSESSKKSFQSYLGNKFNSKLEVIYPGIKVNHNLKFLLGQKEKEKLNILFVGRYFERKGGEELIGIIKKFENNNSIYFHIVSDCNLIHQKYFSSLDNVKYYGLLNREKIKDIYIKSDIFLMPTFYDIFGYVFLEAFSFGVIPISLDDYAIGEIINNKKDGYIINGYNNIYYNILTRKFIDKYKKINNIINNHSNDEKNRIVLNICDIIYILKENNNFNLISKGYFKVNNGIFSIKYRNKKLKNIL